MLEKQRSLENKIKFQFLYYPATDYTMDSESHRLFGKGHFLTKEVIKFFYSSYLRDENDQCNMIAFSSNATVQDLSGLPPALMITGEADPLRDGNKHRV